MIDLIISIVTLTVAYFIGTTIIEKKHYKSIKEREHQLLRLPAVTSKNILDEGQVIKDSRFVYGSIVISVDYFKRFLAGLRNFFGGEMRSYETILDRSRREAILRMKESAQDADIIINMRLETANIGGANSKKGVGCSEVVAYGTAVTFMEKQKSADLKSSQSASQPVSNNISIDKISNNKALSSKEDISSVSTVKEDLSLGLLEPSNKVTVEIKPVKITTPHLQSVSERVIQLDKTVPRKKTLDLFDYIILSIGIGVLILLIFLIIKH